MNSQPAENLELQALEQRSQLHKRADELRTKIETEKEKLSPAHQVRKHFVVASIVASVIGLGLGYGVAGLFQQHE